MRKKSIRKAAWSFRDNVQEILDFTQRSKAAIRLNKKDESWCYDLAVIRVYREFEDLMLSCLVSLINGDSGTFSEHKNRNFPSHMNVEVCEYLICGDGHFDFSGRSGLIKTIKKVVPAGHWFLNIVNNDIYSGSLDQLSALRNFAAHDSPVSKKHALRAVNQARMSSSGAWLKKQERLDSICRDLTSMAQEIHDSAQY